METIETCLELNIKMFIEVKAYQHSVKVHGVLVTDSYGKDKEVNQLQAKLPLGWAVGCQAKGCLQYLSN